MKLLLHLLLLAMMGNAYAQSNLPACQGDRTYWNNCMGTINLNYGDWYFGEWKNGKLEGHGTYHVESGLSTEAFHFNNRLLSGTAQYTGEFRNNKRNGFGIMKYSLHAEQYIGFWLDNKFHGEGIFIYGDNQLEKIKEGLWINGTFQKELKVSFNYKLDEINVSKSTLAQ